MSTTEVGGLFSALDLSIFSIASLVLLALLLSSYVKIVTVLSIIRVGFGVQSLPAAIVTGGLALSLAFFVMYPTIWKSFESMEAARKSSSPAELRTKSIEAALANWKEFLLKHTHSDVHERFISMQGSPKPTWRTVVPAFYISELKEAFATGLSLFLPFLVLDICVAVTLAALGVQSLDTHVVALPFKILLFVMLDGWTLIGANLVESYS